MLESFLGQGQGPMLEAQNRAPDPILILDGELKERRWGLAAPTSLHCHARNPVRRPVLEIDHNHRTLPR